MGKIESDIDSTYIKVQKVKCVGNVIFLGTNKKKDMINKIPNIHLIKN